MTSEGFDHKAIDWLAESVQGFGWAYVHSAEFKAMVHNQLQLMRLQIELMAIGAQTKEGQRQEAIRRLEREPMSPIVLSDADAQKVRDLIDSGHPDRPLPGVVADSEQGMRRGE